MELVTYNTESGRSPFDDWYDRLEREAKARITKALQRLEQGNLSSAKGVGSGVFELRIDFGPGYRVYFGRDGQTIILLLTGGRGRS